MIWRFLTVCGFYLIWLPIQIELLSSWPSKMGLFGTFTLGHTSADATRVQQILALELFTYLDFCLLFFLRSFINSLVSNQPSHVFNWLFKKNMFYSTFLDGGRPGGELTEYLGLP